MWNVAVDVRALFVSSVIFWGPDDLNLLHGNGGVGWGLLYPMFEEKCCA
jgi:hypothetical protein